ncbi:MAG: hypothetical protein R3F65_08045 [bacterium]
MDTRPEPPPLGIHPTTWMVLRALRSGARLSRNRNFYLFEDPRARHAIKLHRYLEGLIRDVKAAGDQISVHIVDGGTTPRDVALRLDFPVLHGTRTAYLSRIELRLLAEQAPEVAHAISAALDEGD